MKALRRFWKRENRYLKENEFRALCFAFLSVKLAESMHGASLTEPGAVATALNLPEKLEADHAKSLPLSAGMRIG
jgi:hypothetical protein